MASRQSLIDWCKRSLGYPVVEINIADEQIQDRVDEALAYWNLYHYEGSEKLYLTHRITCSEVHIVGSNGPAFGLGQTITGTTSGTTALVQAPVGGQATNVIRIRNVKGVFQAGESITNGTDTATLQATTFYIPGDTENHWIPIPDNIWGVTKVFPFLQNSSSQNLFDVQYQLMLNDMRNLTSTDLTYYVQAMSHLDLLQSTLSPLPDFEFVRQMGQLRIDSSWQTRIQTDQFVCVEAYRPLDPETFTNVYNEPWLRLYTTALFKRQWGINLKKFSGLQLPGGVTLDGQSLFQEAIVEITQLEEKLMINSAPLGFIMG